MTADRSGSGERVRVDGLFFRAGSERFRIRGVTYGTFGPNKAGDPFPEPSVVERDLELAVELGANTLRVYDVPPPWLLDAAAARGLRLWVGIPWAWESCFLETRASRREARTAVTTGVRSLGGHPAVVAVAVANEIPADIVRWSGAERVERFIDELVDAVHDADPGCLCTYASFPTTEFLRPLRVDFVTFNVFLHERPVLSDYLARLQMIAEGKPLVLGECGVDARREGADHQARIVAENLEEAARAGLAGAVVFSLTDEWVRSGVPVEDWEFGLTTRTRERRPAFAAVQERFREPVPPPAATPRVSVVVATYNSVRTLAACLDSLLAVDYPDLEILVIDDGSTDGTPDITVRYPGVRTLRHPVNRGLSEARNLGIQAATGEVVAFTDADCRVDRDWLRHLVAALTRGTLAGVGGPNLLPPDDSAVAAAVMVSPGGPAHVMLTDRIAEHIPGCNMAFWKKALEAIGRFDPMFRQAGDDVDVCWRIQRRGWQIGFAPAAFVWHHRRATVGDYLRQQVGYGAAEAMLVNKHPEHFNALGGAQWRGRICAAGRGRMPWHRSVIHHGVFGTGLFQTLYTPATDGWVPLLTSIEYHVTVAVPLLVLAFVVPWLWPLAIAAWAVPPVICVAAASQVLLPPDRRRWWSRPLVAVLHYLQPLARGSARYRARLNLRSDEATETDALEALSRVYHEGGVRERTYWSQAWRDRREWLERILRELEKRRWPCRTDAGWSHSDLAVFGCRWTWIEFVTVAEANRDRSQTLRGRLRSKWTLTADLLFWVALAVQVLVIGVFDVNWKGWWIPVVTQGAIVWWLRRKGHALRCRFAVLLDSVAREWGLTPIDPGSASKGSGESVVR